MANITESDQRALSIEEQCHSIVNSLNDQLTLLSDLSTRDRPAKRRAMESIRQDALNSVAKQPDADKMLPILFTCLYPRLLHCAQSVIESVREQSVTMMLQYIGYGWPTDNNENIIHLLLEAAKQRLKRQVDKTFVEPTEEIRYLWIQLVHGLLRHIPENGIMQSDAELCFSVLRLSITDPFPDVQKEGAASLITFSKRQTKAVGFMGDHAIGAIKPLLLHKHAAIRVYGIEAAKAILSVTSQGVPLLFIYDEADDRQAIVPNLVFDQSAAVRTALFQAMGDLLAEWSPRDRYAYADQLLPVLMAGTFDELSPVIETSQGKLSRVGEICTDDLVAAEILEQPAAGASTVGLQHLVHHCYDKALKELLQESTEFILVKQKKALEVLRLFVEYATVDDIVRSLKKILNRLVMVYANGSSENILSVKIKEIAQTIAQKVPSPEIYIEVLLPRLEKLKLNSELKPEATVSAVVAILDFLIQDTKADSLGDVAKQRIMSTLSKNYIQAYLTTDAGVHDAHLESIRRLLM